MDAQRLKKLKLSPRQSAVLEAVGEGRDPFDRQRPHDSERALRELEAMGLVAPTEHQLTSDGHQKYVQTRKIKTHTITKGRHLYLIVTDPMSGRTGRFTVHKIQLYGMCKTKVIGRELPFRDALGVTLKEDGLAW